MASERLEAGSTVAGRRILINLVAIIPLAGLIATGTSIWSLISNLWTHLRSPSVAEIATVATVVYTRRLAIGRLVAVTLSVNDVSRVHIWNIDSVWELGMAIVQPSGKGAGFELIGMREASKMPVDKLAIHDMPGMLDKIPH